LLADGCAQVFKKRLGALKGGDRNVCRGVSVGGPEKEVIEGGSLTVTTGVQLRQLSTGVGGGEEKTRMEGGPISSGSGMAKESFQGKGPTIQKSSRT